MPLFELAMRGNRPTPYEPRKGMLYLTAACLPYHINGYTTRSHGILRALRTCGIDFVAVSRPGYPWDRKDRLKASEGASTIVEGISYQHIPAPGKFTPLPYYAFMGARKLVDLAIRDRVGVIHAASNHVSALPGLLAARRLNIPFHYEIRGLWELSRISRQPEFEGSPAYDQGLALEAFIARHADMVFVISRELERYIVDNWGINPEKIRLLPNCVDSDRICPDSLPVEKFSIGYAGSLVAYEGLDTLLDALAILRGKNVPAKLKIIGDGEAGESLRLLANELGLKDAVEFTGRVEPAMAREQLKRCSLVCIPRKPFKVCEIITPLKLVEAMALGKAIVAPDLPVFREELGEDGADWLFCSGNAADLAAVLERKLSSPHLLAEQGAKMRDRVIASRQWKQFLGEMCPFGMPR